MSHEKSDSSGARPSEPHPWVETENRRGVIVEADGTVDTTIRPARSPLLRQVRPDQPPTPPPEKK